MADKRDTLDPMTIDWVAGTIAELGQTRGTRVERDLCVRLADKFARLARDLLRDQANVSDAAEAAHTDAHLLP